MQESPSSDKEDREVAAVSYGLGNWRLFVSRLGGLKGADVVIVQKLDVVVSLAGDGFEWLGWVGCWVVAEESMGLGNGMNGIGGLCLRL